MLAQRLFYQVPGVRRYIILRGCQSYRRYVSNTSFKAEKPESIKTLAIPIGVEKKPAITDNDGIDHRTREEKKRDFTDMDKNRARREELKKEFARSTFAPIYQFRHTGGKIFRGPAMPFSKREALYMPNFRGHTLDKEETGTWQFIGEKPTVVRVFGSRLAEKQLESYTDRIDFENLNALLLDVNVPTNFVNEWLVKLSSNNLQKSLKGIYHKYMICRKGVTPEVRNSIAAGNPLAGYLYVLDSDGKIRWATAGPAEAGEVEIVQSLLAPK